MSQGVTPRTGPRQKPRPTTLPRSRLTSDHSRPSCDRRSRCSGSESISSPPLTRPRRYPSPPPPLHSHRVRRSLRYQGLPCQHLRSYASTSPQVLQIPRPRQVPRHLAKADVPAAIAKEPRLLCCSVDKTLAPRIGKLRDIGLAPPQIRYLIINMPFILRNQTWLSRFGFYLSLLGSIEKVHAALKVSLYLFSRDVERVVMPNIAFLRQCGQTDIVKIFSLAPRMVLLEPERVKEIVACADRLGVPRDSTVFKLALKAIYSIRPERISARSDLLKKALGCSEDELSIAVRLFPDVLKFSTDKMIGVVEFLKEEVGLKTHYVVRRPALLAYSLKRRLMPRHNVLKVLKSNGLVAKDRDFYKVVGLSEERFAKKFLDPYKEAVPGLADAAALSRPISS